MTLVAIGAPAYGLCVTPLIANAPPSAPAPALGTGIYSVPEASRVTGIHRSRIRRWMRGYSYRRSDGHGRSAAIWHGQLEPRGSAFALGFRDLMEVRFVDAFLKAGVSWKTMRLAHGHARHELGTEHPFCSNRFVTDGRSILLHEAEKSGDAALLDIVSRQREFARIVEPFFKQLEFSPDQQLLRWWPLGRQRAVVLDPSRNFGQPSVAKSGVPTHVLAESLKANGSADEVARWYEVQPEEVRDAAAFEAGLAA